MKAAQITQYTKNIRIKVNNVPIPKMGDHDVLIRVKAAAVNPVDILNLTGAVRLIQDYRMPLTLGNECAGIVEKAGKDVTRFAVGDRVYSRVPISSLGAFAEYVAIPENAVAHMPDGLDFSVAVAIPLTGLTAYQAITEELHAKPGETLFIPGGSGSFGQMAVPIAKALGLHVIVSGNGRADGMQLEEITRIVETENIVPQIDSRIFDLMQINDAVRLLHEGHTSGKIIIRFP